MWRKDSGLTKAAREELREALARELGASRGRVCYITWKRLVKRNRRLAKGFMWLKLNLQEVLPRSVMCENGLWVLVKCERRNSVMNYIYIREVGG